MLFTVPKLMMMLWYMQVDIKKNISWIRICSQVVTFIQYMIHIMYPAIFAELLGSEVGALKLVLNEHLREEETVDKRTRMDLKQLTRYVKARPLNELVLRFIPLGFRQVLSIMSFCTTYIIVIVQFTHIYD
ncbi:hypothetical protein O0L34_g17389 [Tuta absoluta]|nr:hypothetical protein O0L34_g17389 [Tuta absoluta]